MKSIPDNDADHTLMIYQNFVSGLREYEPFFHKPSDAVNQWITQCELEKKIYNAKGNGQYKWTTSELLSIRGYTNTNALCSKYRQSFWKNNKLSSGSTLRDEFWIWAVQMYNTYTCCSIGTIPSNRRF